MGSLCFSYQQSELRIKSFSWWLMSFMFRSTCRCFCVKHERNQPILTSPTNATTPSDCAQTGPMLAGMLGWPQATFAAKVESVAVAAVVAGGDCSVHGGGDGVLVYYVSTFVTDHEPTKPNQSDRCQGGRQRFYGGARNGQRHRGCSQTPF